MTVPARTQLRSIVDTSALRHNLARVRELAPGSRVAAVVKANAYGHGLVAAARALTASDALAVARLEEGLVLRAAGIDQRVLLLEGVLAPDELEQARRHRLDLMVHSFEQIELLESRPGAAPLRVWLKLDTGMNRLGFRPEDFVAAHARLTRVRGLESPPLLVTHLANADERGDPMTVAQLDRFAAATAGYAGERSIANSAGVLAWPASHTDWVRPGLMLYGIAPYPGTTGSDFALRPAMTFETAVIAVRTVQSGESVGYRALWRAQRESRLAIVACGYGDGYPRAAGTGTPVMISGRRAPLVGRVSMDMLTVDVTDLPGVRPGDPVTLWGEGVAVEEVATHAGAIPYELICGVGSRVRRETR
ncbi:MAG TPA: alanine racemase [Burkholderiales bacterium]|nr:alanine racemase [Burkholderiales bacterium]